MPALMKIGFVFLALYAAYALAQSIFPGVFDSLFAQPPASPDQAPSLSQGSMAPLFAAVVVATIGAQVLSPLLRMIAGSRASTEPAELVPGSANGQFQIRTPRGIQNAPRIL